jgi:hypothetical protein
MIVTSGLSASVLVSEWENYQIGGRTVMADGDVDPVYTYMAGLGGAPIGRRT